MSRYNLFLSDTMQLCEILKENKTLISLNLSENINMTYNHRSSSCSTSGMKAFLRLVEENSSLVEIQLPSVEKMGQGLDQGQIDSIKKLREEIEYSLKDNITLIPERIEEIESKLHNPEALQKDEILLTLKTIQAQCHHLLDKMDINALGIQSQTIKGWLTTATSLSEKIQPTNADSNQSLSDKQKVRRPYHGQFFLPLIPKPPRPMFEKSKKLLEQEKQEKMKMEQRQNEESLSDDTSYQ